jgi:hypothetical protein
MVIVCLLTMFVVRSLAGTSVSTQIPPSAAGAHFLVGLGQPTLSRGVVNCITRGDTIIRGWVVIVVMVQSRHSKLNLQNLTFLVIPQYDREI